MTIVWEFNRFDTIHERDGQTDRQTDRQAPHGGLGRAQAASAATEFINPLDSKSNYSATSNNTKLRGGLFHLAQRGGAGRAAGPAQSPPRCTKSNSPPINGQCTNHASVPITVLLYDGPLRCGFNVAIKALRDRVTSAIIVYVIFAYGSILTAANAVTAAVDSIQFACMECCSVVYSTAAKVWSTTRTRTTRPCYTTPHTPATWR